MSRSLQRNWGELASPLALASYAAWGAVYVTVTGLFGLPGAELGWPAQVMMLGFLAAWVLLLLMDEPTDGWLQDCCLVLLVITALGLLMLGNSGSSPILLILLATMLAARFPDRGMAAALLAINLVFLLILRFVWEWNWGWALTSMASFGAFQAFAALTMHYARKAEKMAGELREVNAHLLATRSILAETARDQERLRLSRELHDVAGHKLTALKLNLRNLARRPDLDGSPELVTAASLAEELLDDLRAVVRQLRRDDGIDLAAGIRRLIEPLPSPNVELNLAPDVRVPRADQAETLLRVVQEGLTNAARHGRARRAWLDFGRDRGEFWLRLEDDGQLDWPIRPGNGLTGMGERVAELGGNLELTPSPRGGLRLEARLPVESPA